MGKLPWPWKAIAHHRLLEDPGAMLQAQRVLQAAPKARTTSKTLLVSMFIHKSSSALGTLRHPCSDPFFARALPHFVTPSLARAFLNTRQHRYGRIHVPFLF
jgi:hypothetical protein